MKPSKVHKISTASTATGFYKTKDLQKWGFIRGRYCGRYLDLRSILASLRSIASDNIARTKYPQMSTFAALRSMRAVFCGGFCIVERSGYFFRETSLMGHR